MFDMLKSTVLKLLNGNVVSVLSGAYYIMHLLNGGSEQDGNTIWYSVVAENSLSLQRNGLKNPTFFFSAWM